MVLQLIQYFHLEIIAKYHVHAAWYEVIFMLIQFKQFAFRDSAIAIRTRSCGTDSFCAFARRRLHGIVCRKVAVGAQTVPGRHFLIAIAFSVFRSCHEDICMTGAMSYVHERRAATTLFWESAAFSLQSWSPRNARFGGVCNRR